MLCSFRVIIVDQTAVEDCQTDHAHATLACVTRIVMIGECRAVFILKLTY